MDLIKDYFVRNLFIIIVSIAIYLFFGGLIFLYACIKKPHQNNELKIFKILILIVGFYYIFLASFSYLSSDELEHIQCSWLVFRGRIPYVDFFQHHHGLIWYVFSLVFYVSGESATSVILIRLINLSFAFGILYCIYLIALQISKSKKTAIFTVVIAMFVNLFTRCFLEVRPDVLMTLFIFLSFLHFTKFWNTKERRFLIYCGVVLAFAFFALQKAAFFIIPFYFAIIFLLFLKRIKLKQVLILSISSLLPLLIYVAIVWLSGRFNEYIAFNWIYNYLKPGTQPFISFFSLCFSSVPNFLWFLTFLFLFLLTTIFFIQNFKKTTVLLKVSFFIGVSGFVIQSTFPTVYIWYFIWVLPFIIIPAAYFLIQVIDRHIIVVKYQYLLLYFFCAPLVYGLDSFVKHLDLNFPKQMKENMKIVEDIGFSGKVLTSAPSLLFYENIHFLFYHTTKNIDGELVIKFMATNEKFKKWVTQKIKKDANYNPAEIMQKEKPKYIYAEPDFIKFWELQDLIEEEYYPVGYQWFYKLKK